MGRIAHHLLVRLDGAQANNVDLPVGPDHGLHTRDSSRASAFWYGWRKTVLVANGAGEDLFSATKLMDTRWIVSGWKERDSRGHVVVHGDPFYWDGADARDAQASEAQPVATGDQYAFRSQVLEYDALEDCGSRPCPTRRPSRLCIRRSGRQ